MIVTVINQYTCMDFFFLHIFQACLWISIPVLGRNDSLPQCANLNYQIHHMRKNIAAESLWGLVFSGVCSLFWFNMWRTPPSPTVDSVSHVAGARLKEPLLQRVKYSVCLSDTHFLSPPPPPSLHVNVKPVWNHESYALYWMVQCLHWGSGNSLPYSVAHHFLNADLWTCVDRHKEREQEHLYGSTIKMDCSIYCFIK